MCWCFVSLLLARGEAEASVTVVDSRCGAAKLPGSAVPRCYAALVRQLAQSAGDGVSGVNRTEGCHRDT